MASKNNHSLVKPWARKPLADAVISKLVPKNNNNILGNDGQLGHGMLVQRISSLTSTDISDATALQDLLPEQQLMMQILVSSILSPKDLTTVELTYAVTDKIFTSQLASPLLEVISTFFEEDYKIEKRMSGMLEDMLFTKGSCPMLVLPETSIDAMINGTATISNEAIKDEFTPSKGQANPLGILGNKRKAGATVNAASLESMMLMQGVDYRPGEYDSSVGVPLESAPEVNMYLSVIDNPSALKMPKVLDKLSRKLALQRVSANFVKSMPSNEAVSDTADLSAPKKAKKAKGMSEREISALYKSRPSQHTPIVTVQKTADLQRATIGHPTTLKVPAEAVVPVFTPGDPTNHIGYFILTDRNGNFVSSSKSADAYRDMEKNAAMNKDQIGAMLTTNMQDINGRKYTQTDIDRLEMANIYTQIVEADLKHRLATGVYGDNVDIARAPEAMRIMLSRTLARQHTQMLYVPSELMTYFAFDYNEYGIGQSLTDKNKILGSIRAMLLFANTMAGIKNAVGRVQVNIALDDADTNPSETVEILMHNYMQNRGSGAPFGTMNPVEIVDYLNVAAVELNVEGNSRYPQTKFSVDDKNSQKQMVDTTLEDEMRKRYVMGFGMTPETVDASNGPDFATTILQNNLLFAKQMMVYQTTFTEHLSSFMRTYVLNSQVLMDQLREVVRQNMKLVKGELKTALKENEYEKDGEVDAVVEMFLDTFNVTLPAPDTGSIESQLQAMDTYAKAIDAGLDAYFNESFIDASLYGDEADVLLKMRAAYKAKFLRDYMLKNNILPELTQMVTKNEDGKPALDLLDSHKNLMDSLLESAGSFLEEAKKERKQAEAKQDKINQTLGITDQPDGMGGDPLGDGMGDDGLGGDPDGLNDDTAMAGDDAFDGGGLSDDLSNTDTMDDTSGTDLTAKDDTGTLDGTSADKTATDGDESDLNTDLSVDAMDEPESSDESKPDASEAKDAKPTEDDADDSTALASDLSHKPPKDIVNDTDEKDDDTDNTGDIDDSKDLSADLDTGGDNTVDDDNSHDLSEDLGPKDESEEDPDDSEHLSKDLDTGDDTSLDADNSDELANDLDNGKDDEADAEADALELSKNLDDGSGKEMDENSDELASDLEDGTGKTDDDESEDEPDLTKKKKLSEDDVDDYLDDDKKKK